MADAVALSGLLSVLFLLLSIACVLLKRARKTFHRYFAVLATLSAVVHVALVLQPDPETLRALSGTEVSGLTAIGGLFVTGLSARRRAPRRSHAATTEARARSARSWSARHPNASRIVHWLPGIVTVAALTAHVILIQGGTFHRFLWLIVGEGIALVMIGRYVIPYAWRRHSFTPPRHLHTPTTHTAEHATGVLLRTTPFPDLTPTRLVPTQRIGITAIPQIPLCLAHSPDIVYVVIGDKADLLRHRRELALVGGRARYVNSLTDLNAQLPVGMERRIANYVVAGDPDFAATVQTLLPTDRVIIETTGTAPVLPVDHPSARVTRAKHRAVR